MSLVQQRRGYFGEFGGSFVPPELQEALDYYIISMKFRRNFQLPADKQLKQLWAQVRLVLRNLAYLPTY